MILSPLDVVCRVSGLGLMSDRGLSIAGRITDLQVEQHGRAYLFSWAVEEWHGAGTAAVFVFLNGERIARIVGETTWSFIPASGDDVYTLHFYLMPAHEAWASVCWPRVPCNRAGIDYNLAGDAVTATVYGNAGASVTGAVLATLRDLEGSIPTAAGSVSGGEAYCSGRWIGPRGYTTLTLEITTGGVAGVAEFEWSWAAETGTGTTSEVAAFLINGLRIWFEADHTFSVGDTWTIRVGLAQTYTTKRFATAGDHSFRIDTQADAGSATQSDPALNTVTLHNQPDPPTVESVTAYVGGSGELEVTFLSPDQAAVDGYRVYRNWPGAGARELHWQPIEVGSVAADTEFEVTVTGLVEGINRVGASVLWTVGDQVWESEPVWTEITLDAGLDEVGETPNPPESIAARVNSSGHIVVTVWVDDTADTVNVYRNDGAGGAVDYGTVRATGAVGTDGLNKVTLTISSGLGTGNYIVAARAELDGTEEANTNVRTTVKRVASGGAAQATGVVVTPCV